jgi:hypothetical protein
MNDHDNNFEELRRLLTLKRHEVPPPGYFENFSDNVIARIQAGETARELPWLLRFLQAFESRPAYPVAFASSLCMVLLFGIVSVQQSTEIGTGFATMPTSSPFAMSSGNGLSSSSGQQMPAVGDTNAPINFSDPSLFQSQPKNTLFQQSSYSQPGN